MYKDLIFPLKEYFSIKSIDIEKDNNLEIKLLSFEYISDFSNIFHKCVLLEEFQFIQNNENIIINEYENIDNNNNIISETSDDEDEKYYNFYGYDKNNEYLNSIITLMYYKSEINSPLSYTIFKESRLAYLYVKNSNKLAHCKNLDNPEFHVIISETFIQII